MNQIAKTYLQLNCFIMINNYLKWRHAVLYLIAFTCLANVTGAQSLVSGRITLNAEPVPGVNVLVKGTSAGTVSDVEGNYSISVPDTDATLVFSFIGYLTEEVEVNNRSIININL